MDVKPGTPVIYTDLRGVDHHALVTRVWNPEMIDLVYVTNDERRTDQYGQQLQREKAVWLKAQRNAFVNFWRPVEVEFSSRAISA